jgi:hypothetical protein
MLDNDADDSANRTGSDGELVAQVFCSHCGTVNREDYNYCFKCGEPLNTSKPDSASHSLADLAQYAARRDPDPRTPEIASHQHVSPPSGSNRFLEVVSVLGVVALLGVIVFLTVRNSPNSLPRTNTLFTSNTPFSLPINTPTVPVISSADTDFNCLKGLASQKNKLAVANFQIIELQITNSEGGGVACTLITTPNGQLYNPSWSPDGTKLAFIVMTNSVETATLYTINTDGSNLQTVAENFRLAKPTVVWSPDGTKLAFTAVFSGSRLCHLSTINADGTELRSVTYDEQACWRSSVPVWSPDGNEIAYVMIDRFGDKRLHIIKAAAFSEPSEPVIDTIVDSPTWSPDGTMLAFLEPTPEGTYIYVMQANRSKLRKIAKVAPVPLENQWLASSPLEWSPDNKRIIFSYLELPLTVVKVDTSTVEQYDGFKAYHASWSADGTRIALLMYDGQLMLVNANNFNEFISTKIYGNGIEWSP